MFSPPFTATVEATPGWLWFAINLAEEFLSFVKSQMAATNVHPFVFYFSRLIRHSHLQGENKFLTMLSVS